jgi:DNA mismatch repair ATPase MutL
MSENILDLQRLPEISSLGFGGEAGDATCTVCSYTCCCTAKEN